MVYILLCLLCNSAICEGSVWLWSEIRCLPGISPVVVTLAPLQMAGIMLKYCCTVNFFCHRVPDRKLYIILKVESKNVIYIYFMCFRFFLFFLIGSQFNSQTVPGKHVVWSLQTWEKNTFTWICLNFLDLVYVGNWTFWSKNTYLWVYIGSV